MHTIKPIQEVVTQFVCGIFIVDCMALTAMHKLL